MRANPLKLIARDLTTGYRALRTERVVTRASFAVEPGTIVALVGPNGSGKSTLLHTLIGLIPPLAGSVSIGGLSPVEYRRSHGIGYLAEGITLPDDWSGHGLLALTALASGGNAPASIPHALRIAGVDFDLACAIRKLSKGMRQRLTLALTLMPLPSLLLLDEPEAGLDPAQRIGLRDRIRAFAREDRIVIVASHDISGLSQIADHTYLMTNGVMQRLDPADLADPERVLRLFATPGGAA